MPKGSRSEKPERALALFPWSGMREVTEASYASTDSGAEARFLGTNVVPGMVIVRDLLETVLPRKTVGQYDLRKRRCNGGLLSEVPTGLVSEVPAEVFPFPS